jgi:hypothetical protein
LLVAGLEPALVFLHGLLAGGIEPDHPGALLNLELHEAL